MHSKRPSRLFLEVIVICICTVIFAFSVAGILASLLAPGQIGIRDFVEYWASSRLLLSHQDPYSAQLILPIERSVNFPPSLPALVTPNPPWALPLIAPLGLFSARVALFFWFLLSIVCLASSVQMFSRIHDRAKSPLRIFGYIFAPALSCLLSGQITIFIVFGLVLFLRFHKTHPFGAGAALWFCLLKPHLFVPFGIALTIWVVLTRSYRILAGAATALFIGSSFALLFDSKVWNHYGAMMVSSRIDRVSIPCLSIALREIMSPHFAWVQWLPVVLGSIWTIAYLKRNSEKWDWIEHGLLVVFVSVLIAPYTWLMDQAVLIPGLMQGIYTTRSRTLLALLALASATIEMEIIFGIPLLHSRLYLWTAPAWLAWYVLAVRHRYATKKYEPPPLEKGTELVIEKA